MLVSTSENISGRVVVGVKGIAFGVSVRARGYIPVLWAIFRAKFGGEVKVFSKLGNDAQNQAVERLCENARLMGANAVVMMRFDSNPMRASKKTGNSVTQIVAYGTAIVLE